MGCVLEVAFLLVKTRQNCENAECSRCNLRQIGVSCFGSSIGSSVTGDADVAWQPAEVNVEA